MTNAEMLSLMMGRLGSRTAPALRANVLKELNEKIKELEVGPIKPWFMEDLASGSTVAGQNYINLPTDFLQEVDEGRVRLQNLEGVWFPLGKGTMEQLEDEFLNDEAAFPQGYALQGTRMYLGPAPDDVYAYRFQYFKKSTTILDNNTEVSNPWLVEFFNFTTLAALSTVARLHVQSMDIVTKLDAELKTAFDGFWRAVEARKHTNMDYMLGDEEN